MHLVSGSVALVVTLAAGQTMADVRKLYDAGKYQEVVRMSDATKADADIAPRVRHLAAQSYAKLNDTDGARRTYQELANRGATPWAPIGRAALQLMDKQLDAALASADQAVRMASPPPEAYYQRGLVLMVRKDYPNAVSAFTKAIELDPAFAAAYYYAGLANYQVKRIDLMTNHFTTFIKLAPNAPERPEVESILRTVRGRD